jgi:hypothetical protein
MVGKRAQSRAFRDAFQARLRHPTGNGGDASPPVASAWQTWIILPPCGGISPPAKREVVMKAIHWIIAAAALSFVQPTSASAAVGDPEVIIYRFPGVLDNGGASATGVVTAFHCTNFSGVTETIRFVTRSNVGTLLQNSTTTIAHLATRTANAHFPNSYSTDLNLATGVVVQGTTAIAATSINIICTAMTIDGSTTVPVGVALRGIRFNPVPGSQE